MLKNIRFREEDHGLGSNPAKQEGADKRESLGHLTTLLVFRIRNNTVQYFRIRIQEKVPDTTGSGSTTLLSTQTHC